MFSAADQEYMWQALRLAERGLYTATPNPRVGCVVVRGGKVVGQGWHARTGEAHAEVIALRQAGALAKDATLYVTLEPCNHFGRTPPCTDAIIEAGIKRVVAAMYDPNPLVAHAGIKKLQAFGIEVATGLLENEAIELNKGFVFRMTRRRPLVRLKTASSIDGKTALDNGVSKWITGADARKDVHEWRARSCAVLTGIGTVLTDDPSLNVRDVETTRQPLRVILDSRLRTPPGAKVLRDGNVLIVTAVENTARQNEFREKGVEVLTLKHPSGQVDLNLVLEMLAGRGINELMVEAGGILNGAFVSANLVDELIMYFAPVLLGDKARGMFKLKEITEMSEKRELEVRDMRMFGSDLRICARLLDRK
jgi:diaminohydroxyphosphoribosylaminopyrimidine deaminase/5-amino-6-(5-phosphoribosylamino)uracil reductase